MLGTLLGATVPSEVAAPSAPAEARGRQRFEAVDLLRGLVMVLMALDHTRDFFGRGLHAPTDLAETTAPLFLTRWITHFCAPAFVFLAGTGAFLSLGRGKTRRQLAWFLATRGVWLVVLELTVIRVGWTFSLRPAGGFFVQVIWVLGVSMIVLAGLVHLPRGAVAAFGVVMIAAHNLFDGVSAAALGRWAPLWTVLHVPGYAELVGGTLSVQVLYPLIPWVGVMAAGYAFGGFLQRPADERRRLLLRLGGALTLAFVLVRAWNVYGDPSPWSPQKSALFTVLSFLNTTKYPPSLSFLLMTLGPLIAALSVFERRSGPAARFFIVFGRVPLFYYVLHLYLLHGLAVAAAMFQFGGFGLAGVYLVWAAAVVLLYPLCRWFAALKARRRDVWLSYL